MMSALSHSTAALLSALALGQAAPVNSQEEGPSGRADVICFAVAVHLGTVGDQDAKQAADILAFYYFGRAQAQMPEATLVEELRTAVSRISGERWEAEKTRCGAGLAEAGELLLRSVDALTTELGE